MYKSYIYKIKIFLKIAVLTSYTISSLFSLSFIKCCLQLSEISCKMWVNALSANGIRVLKNNLHVNQTRTVSAVECLYIEILTMIKKKFQPIFLIFRNPPSPLLLVFSFHFRSFKPKLHPLNNFCFPSKASMLWKTKHASCRIHNLYKQ